MTNRTAASASVIATTVARVVTAIVVTYRAICVVVVFKSYLVVYR